MAQSSEDHGLVSPLPLLLLGWAGCPLFLAWIKHMGPVRPFLFMPVTRLKFAFCKSARRARLYKSHRASSPQVARTRHCLGSWGVQGTEQLLPVTLDVPLCNDIKGYVLPHQGLWFSTLCRTVTRRDQPLCIISLTSPLGCQGFSLNESFTSISLFNNLNPKAGQSLGVS